MRPRGLALALALIAPVATGVWPHSVRMSLAGGDAQTAVVMHMAASDAGHGRRAAPGGASHHTGSRADESRPDHGPHHDGGHGDETCPCCDSLFGCCSAAVAVRAGPAMPDPRPAPAGPLATGVAPDLYIPFTVPLDYLPPANGPPLL